MVRKLAQELSTTIALGGTTSATIDLENPDGIDPELRLFAIAMPSAFTGTALAFEVYNTTQAAWLSMTDDAGTAFSVVVSAGKLAVLDPSVFAAVSKFRIVSNGTEVAERTIGLVLRNV